MKSPLFHLMLLTMGAMPALMTPGFADTVFKLKSAIEIKVGTISLADLIDGPAVPNDPLFGAPLPGKSGTIQATRIAAAFKKATGQTLNFAPDSAVHVARRARIIGEADLTHEITRLIKRDFKLDDPEIHLLLDDSVNGIAIEEDATAPVSAAITRFDPQSLRFEAQIAVSDSAVLTEKPVTILGFVAADRIVPVAARAIDKGAALGASDIRMERRLRSSLAGKVIISQADLQNRVALSNLAAGDVVTDDLAGRPLLVEKGSFVTVSYEREGLSLSMRGRAAEAGAMGDVISFTNPQSKKTLFGTVTAPGTVRVTAYSAREARLNAEQPQKTP